jgi:hypothetical protein
MVVRASDRAILEDRGPHVTKAARARARFGNPSRRRDAATPADRDAATIDRDLPMFLRGPAVALVQQRRKSPMALFRWVLVTTLTGMTTTSAPEPRATQVAVQQEPEPRVEIGAAVLTIYDESGRPIVLE